ncbi:MAG TPA: thiopurine S-methyltransferase [Rhodanobacteraceae bacterium]
METEYWLQRWREGRTGWHHASVMPLLEKHWPALGIGRDTRVLVPLCGKSLDMLWLSMQGMLVLGVDVSAIAIESFLAENRLHARTRTAPDGTHYDISNSPDGGDIEIINGDLFEVNARQFAECHAFYDRAALIALPPPKRERMARDVYAQLPAGARGLLITLDYPREQMQGPPFSVDDDEVHRLFDAEWEVEQLERRDILDSQPSFAEKGVTALHTSVHALTRRTR